MRHPSGAIAGQPSGAVTGQRSRCVTGRRQEACQEIVKIGQIVQIVQIGQIVKSRGRGPFLQVAVPFLGSLSMVFFRCRPVSLEDLSVIPQLLSPSICRRPSNLSPFGLSPCKSRSVAVHQPSQGVTPESPPKPPGPPSLCDSSYSVNQSTSSSSTS